MRPFLITKYFFPIQNEILLSSAFGFHIDNPRTSEEIEQIRQLIKESHERAQHMRFPPVADNRYMSLKFFLKEVRNYFASKDEYVASFFRDTPMRSERDIYDAMARMLIVVRYDDKGETDRLRADFDRIIKNRRGIVLLEEENPILKQSLRLENYGHLLSLLVREDHNLYSTSIIYGRDLAFFENGASFGKDLFYLATMTNTPARVIKKHSEQWLSFPTIRERLLEAAGSLENGLTKKGIDSAKLLHVGDILRIASDRIEDPGTKLLMLTGLVEMLVTHNPDTSRFNVEDSISRQFQLKVAVLMHRNSHGHVNLPQLKADLRQIYSLRSIVAHGEFGELEKLRRKQKGILDDSISQLFSICRAIVVEFLKDPEFVTFLKSS